MLLEFIPAQFKRPSGLFGIFTSNQMIKYNQKNYETLVKDLALRPHDKLLEIGYGPGIGIRMIAESCSTCKVHGIDFSRLMYKRAGRYNKQFIDNGKVQLQYGNFLKSNIEEKNFNKIFCLNVVYFWSDLIAPFEKIFSLLKEGGSFHIYMADKSFLQQKKLPDTVFNKHSIEHVVDTLKSAGFKTVEHYKDNGHQIKAKK